MLWLLAHAIAVNVYNCVTNNIYNLTTNPKVLHEPTYAKFCYMSSRFYSSTESMAVIVSLFNVTLDIVGNSFLLQTGFLKNFLHLYNRTEHVDITHVSKAVKNTARKMNSTSMTTYAINCLENESCSALQPSPSYTIHINTNWNTRRF